MFWFKKKEKTYPYLGVTPPKRIKIGLLQRFADKLSDWHFTRITASLSSLALILTLPMLWVDLFDRYEQRTTQAWQLITTKAPGNSGKRQALEYLNEYILFFKKRSPLIGVDLSGVFLQGVNLSDANLYKANLSGANLYKANLSGANLYEVNLSGADLNEVNLSDAKLYKADLSGAELSSADLSGANLHEVNLSGADLHKADLSGADLSGADLSGVIGIGLGAFNAACGDEKTNLPHDWVIKSCKRY
ncbi:MAG: hypothetical protein ACI88H_001978 [Cocleimonas sp.]|jgi:hypothetical protein